MIPRLLRNFGASSTSGVIAIADQALVSVASFAVAVFVGRTGGPDELGSYALVLTIVTSFVVAQQSLVTTPFINLRKQTDPPAPGRYAGGSLVNALGLAAIGSVLLVVGGGIADRLDAPRLSGPMFCAAVTLPFFMLREFIRRWYFAHLRFPTALVLDGVFAVTQVGFLLALSSSGRLTASTAFLAAAAGNAIAALPAWFVLREPLGVDVGTVGETIRRNWRFGRWVAVAELSMAARNTAIQWLLTVLQSVAANGVFASAMATIRFSNPLVLGITNIAEPRIVKGLFDGGPDEVRRLVRKLTVLSAIALFPLLAGLVLFGARLVHLLFGAEFGGDAAVVVPLSLAVFVAALAYPMGSAIQALGRPDLNAAVRVSGMVVSLIAAVVLIPRWGVMGAGAALLAAQVLSLGLRAIAYSRVVAGAPDPRHSRGGIDEA